MALPSTAIGSQFGVRARTDLAFDTNDQATLDQIVNTIGSQTNRVQTRVELTLIGFAQRIVPGATIRYYETGKYPMSEYRTGAAAYSSVYVVMDNEIDGIVQKVVCSDVPISPDDLAYVVENRLRDALAATQVPSALTPLSPFQLPTLDPLQPSPPGSYPTWGGASWGAAGPTGGIFTSGANMRAVVNLSSAQILTLHSSPVVAIADPGTGNVIWVKTVFIEVKFGGMAYNGGNLLYVNYSSVGLSPYTLAGISLDKPTSIFNYWGDPGPSYYDGLDPIYGRGVEIVALGADPTLGDGTASVIIDYEVVTLSS
jgi:hypothetical protein